MRLYALAAALLASWLAAGEAHAQSPAMCPGAANVRTVDAPNYTVTTADNCWWLNFTAAGTIQVNLPTPSQYFGPTFQVTLLPLKFGSSINLVVAPDPLTGTQGFVNSVQSLPLTQGSAVELRIGVGPNWYAALFGGGGGSGNVISTAPAPTVGNIVTWSNTIGTAIGDSGVPAAGILALPSTAIDPIGSLQFRTNSGIGGYVIGGSFSTGGGVFDLAVGAGAFNIGSLGGDLAGLLPAPALAVGAASRNVGNLGGGLTGTLPNPGLSASAVLSAIGTPSGDLGGASFSAPLVTGLQGFQISSTPPTPGSSLVWNGSIYAQQIISPGVNQGTGDVSFGPGSGSQATTINPGVVTNSKLAPQQALTVKGNPTAASATTQDLAVAGGLGFSAGGALQISPSGVTAQQITVGSNCWSITLTGQVSAINTGTCGGGTGLTADDGATQLTADDGATVLTADGGVPAVACGALKGAGNVACNAAIVAIVR